jgi:GNAT superfamily N-acetyltransferase
VSSAIVRRCQPDDGALLAGLRRAWVEENSGAEVPDPDYDEGYEAWWQREYGRRVSWVAELDGGQPVGMLNMCVFSRMPAPGRLHSQWGYLANLFVLAEHRNGGVGAALLAACLGYAREQGFVRVVLSPSERSVPFYRRAGFRPAADDLMLLTLTYA